HAARRHGLAGVVGKRLDSRYQPGRRSRSWVETLPRHTQRVVLGGWHAGAGDQPVALLVGVAGDDGPRYLGRVAGGRDARDRAELAERLRGLATVECPFADRPPEDDARGARWVAPDLVGEISYRRWDADGRVRRASWLGLRPDARPDGVRD